MSRLSRPNFGMSRLLRPMSRLSRPHFGMSRLSRPTARLMSRLSKLKLQARLCNLGLNTDVTRPLKSGHESRISTRERFKSIVKYQRILVTNASSFEIKMIKKIYSIFEEEQRNVNQIFLQMRVFELPSFSAEFTMSWLSVRHSIASMSSQFSFSITVIPIALPGFRLRV